MSQPIPGRGLSGLDRLRFLVVTAGGLGLAPVVPGTVGTGGGVLLALLLQVVLPLEWLAPVLWITAALLLAWGCGQTAFSARAFGGDDPGPFVLDEVVGYLVAVALYATLRHAPDATGHTACFLLFRIFDVSKIQPARRLEELPGAAGIMLDDVVAGLYAGLSAWLLLPLLGW